MHVRGRSTHELLAFLVAGGTRAVLAYGLFASFIFVGFHYMLATLFSGGLGVLSGYVMNKRLVFFHQGDSRITRFLVTFGIAYFLSVGSQRALFDLGWVHSHYLSGAIAAAICAVPNFLMNKYFVFSPRN